MNAEQARKATQEAENLINSQYKDIICSINEACSNGKYIIPINIDIIHSVVLTKLSISDGFRIVKRENQSFISWEK